MSEWRNICKKYYFLNFLRKVLSWLVNQSTTMVVITRLYLMSRKYIFNPNNRKLEPQLRLNHFFLEICKSRISYFFGYIPKRPAFFKKIFFFIFLFRTKKKQTKKKQKIIIIYLTNIAPSGLKYPNYSRIYIISGIAGAFDWI